MTDPYLEQTPAEEALSQQPSGTGSTALSAVGTALPEGQALPEEGVPGASETPASPDDQAGAPSPAPGSVPAPVALDPEALTTETDPTAAVEPEPVDDRPEPVVVPADDLATAVAAVRKAVRAGECVVLPTDTVYGIGADAFSATAVQGLLDAKQRGRDMPPPVLMADTVMVDTLARDIPEEARTLAGAYWPGPLTLILPAHSSLRLELGDTRGTIGVRVPDHEVTRAILRATGPLAVSSANISGQEAGTDLDSAKDQLGTSVSVYVDGGATPGPVPSTIVDFASTSSGRVLRVGVISVAEIQAHVPSVVGPEPKPDAPDELAAQTDGRQDTAREGLAEGAPDLPAAADAVPGLAEVALADVALPSPVEASLDGSPVVIEPPQRSDIADDSADDTATPAP